MSSADAISDQQAMEIARKAVEHFMSKNGHNSTTIHEVVLPAVTHQVVTKVEHEDIEAAKDVEHHLEHYHTTLQPVTHTETLEVQHRANVLPVDHKIFEHDDRDEVHRRMAAEAAKFRDEVLVVEGEHTHTHLPAQEGARYHHHVYERIQPVVHKHTIEPWIVHTSHMTREVHHLAARHHKTTMLPHVSLEDFLKQGGILTGREERVDWFEGEPKSAGGVLGDSQKNPLPHELRSIGHEDVARNTAPKQTAEISQAQAAPAVTSEPAPAEAPPSQMDPAHAVELSKTVPSVPEILNASAEQTPVKRQNTSTPAWPQTAAPATEQQSASTDGVRPPPSHADSRLVDGVGMLPSHVRSGAAQQLRSLAGRSGQHAQSSRTKSSRSGAGGAATQDSQTGQQQ